MSFEKYASGRVRSRFSFAQLVTAGLPRLVALCLFSALCVYSFSLSAEDYAYHSVLATAVSFDQGEPVSDPQIQRVAKVVMADSFDAGCRGDILRPALTVLLHRLDGISIVEDYKTWADAHLAAESFMQRMIRCRPADGNAWLREAAIASQIAEDPPSLKQKLAVARALMPYEAEQVFSRLVFMKRISPYALIICEDVARADINAVLRYGSPALKASLSQNMSAPFATLLNDVERESKQPPT